MKCYCLYCKTGSEAKLVRLLKKDMRDLEDRDVTILFPTKIVNERHRGVWRRVEQPLLPGYLFLYLEDDVPFPVFIIRQERDAYRILRYADGSMQLQSSDMQYALWVHNHGGRFEPSTVVFREGQMVKVLDGPLVDMEGRIVKMDRHHKRVIVAFMFAGEERKVNLSIQVVDTTAKGEKSGK